MILEQDLSLGSSGDNVKILQEKLKILGFYNPIITGNFGIATEMGVKAFQKQYKLEETGVVNQATWDLLFQITEPATVLSRADPTLSLNSTGEAVKNLQRKLRALLYYTYDVTGIFDTETQTSVKRFQYHNDLTSTGIVDQNTWNVINYLYGNLNTCVTGEDTNEGDTYYTVKAGDTLYSIAKRFNMTVDEIKRLNNLTSNNLSIGQELLISSLPNTDLPDTENTYYTVKAGDTLYSIARRFNMTVDEIKRLNNLTSNTLSIGQQLLLSTNSNTNPTPNTTFYTVMAGDTLYSIATRFHTTVDTIKSINNLTSNTLSIGQILKIPVTSNYISYTVKPGDTLYSIARNYNVSVDTIMSINNLSSTILTIGETLKIPTN